MKVGVIGSGGREHAICHYIKKSDKVTDIYCFPGNAGTKNLAKNINIDLENFNIVKNYILEENNIVRIIVISDLRERLNILNKERNIQEYNQNNHSPRFFGK